MSTCTSDFKLHTSNFKPALLGLPTLVMLLFCPLSQAALKGGAAKVEITPPLGVTLIGSYGKPSDSVRDALYAKALVLSNSHNTIAIVAADLLYTPLEEITDPVRTIVHEKLGIPRQNIMVCATHTHSGPEVFTRSKLPPKSRVPVSDLAQSYLQVLIRKMADAVVMAHQNMRDVKIGVAAGEVPEVLFNRRPVGKDGRVKTAFTLPPEVVATRRIEPAADGEVCVRFTFSSKGVPLEFGCVDPRVFVLRMEDADGRIVGSLVDFGCHPVSIYPSCPTAISADYPAFLTRVVEQAEGGVCLFTLGLAGNTVPIQRGTGPREQIGKAVGAEAIRKLQFITATSDAALSGMCRQATFPMRKTASDKADATDAQSITTEIQVLRLGDIYILGLPGEVLVEVGREIRKKAGIEKLLITTVTNDTIGYVCHSRAYDEGGYEPESGASLAQGAGEIMVREALALLAQIK
ncbi:MAG: neutral/alkaline non-lysosomal ceramidase N-terminal domain-containing protein [Planctomycetes bacterium]|nr:neutral/alkaline non-lysosomal ceramidase N-terminal domain-containing protein [Planctomycetota bacterium]